MHFLRFKYLGNETDLVNLFALGLYHINSVNNHFTIELQISIYLMEKATAPYFSALAWKIPWTKEPGGLESRDSKSWT